LRPDIAKKPLVSLDVSVPVNCEPSDIVTPAVASNVPATALSGTVVLAGVSVIAVGEGAGGGGAGVGGNGGGAGVGGGAGGGGAGEGDGGGGDEGCDDGAIVHMVCVADIARALETTDR
jgi:hypothetical protein